MRGLALLIVVLAGASAPAWAVDGTPQSEQPAPSAHPSADTSLAGEVWRALLPPAKSDEPTVAAISARIVHLGADAIPVLTGILFGEITEPEELVDVHPRAIELRQQILIASLRRLPAVAVVEHFRTKCGPSAELDVKLLSVRVLGEVGGASALEAVLTIASGIEPIHWMRTYVQMPIEQALTAILSREPRLQKNLAAQTAKLDLRLCPLIVRAVGHVGSPVAAPWLASLIGRDRDLDLTVVEELVRLAEQAYCDLGTSEISKVRGLLESRDVRVQRAAAAGLGALGDAESAPRLVALLGSRDKLVARAAHWSLKKLTAQALGPERAAWTAYCDGEQQWFEEHWNGLVEQLHSDDLASVADAASALAQHPLHKSRAALELRLLLNGDDMSRARLAAGALGTLGARGAVAWLIECLRSPDESLRSSAWQSLRTLTGRKLPPDPESWAELTSS